MAETATHTAVGDTTTVKIPKDAGGFISARLDLLAGASGYTGVLEVSNDDQVNWATPVKMHDPTAGDSGVEISALTTDGQIGWVNNRGYTDARIRCTVFTTPGSGANIRINVRDRS